MTYRTAPYRELTSPELVVRCRCGAEPRHRCADCSRAVCTGGLCWSPVDERCLECASALRDAQTTQAIAAYEAESRKAAKETVALLLILALPAAIRGMLELAKLFGRG